MIERTFLHLPGIGEKRERRLWKDGVADWSTYRSVANVPGVSGHAKRRHDRLIEAAAEARARGDHAFLGRLVPKNEHWRFYAEGLRAGFLDIETTGTSDTDSVTVVGVQELGGGFHQLVRGQGLDGAPLRRLLSRFDMLVTFNGNGFDLPVLRRAYPGSVPDIPHMDLRAPLARLGYKGGLKKIEVALGLARPESVQGLSGYEAVLLWNRFARRDDEEALKTLLAYNREDVVNMVALSDFAASALHDKVCTYWGGTPRGVAWPSGERPAQVPEAVAEIFTVRRVTQKRLEA